jgi:hypothetical protein
MSPTLIALILQYGLQYGPGAIAAIIKLFQTAAPTAEDWQALLAVTSTTARQQMLATLTAHNIDPNSAEGKALLGLVP